MCYNRFMPELPEVETVARHLQHELHGETIASITIPWAKWVKADRLKLLQKELPEHKLKSVERRGKYLVFRFTDGSLLLSHLRMTGRWLVDTPQYNVGKHVSALITFKSGRTAVFHDVRKFGRAAWYHKGEDVPEFDEMGDDPLDPKLTPSKLYDLFQSRHRELKALLLDQGFLAGLGNIYVSEILWHARISPFQRGDELTKLEVTLFLKMMRHVLKLAINLRGTTISDFRGPGDWEGGFQHYLKVYGHQGEGCPRCGTTILRAVQGQRATYYCPTCQK